MRVTRQQAAFSGLLAALMLVTGALMMPTEPTASSGVAPAAVRHP